MESWVKDELKSVCIGILCTVVLLGIFLYFVVRSASAAPREIPVNVVFVSQGGLSEGEAVEYWRQVQVYYRKYGIAVGRHRFRVVADPFPQLNTSNTRQDQVRAWGGWLKKHGLLGTKSIAHVITPLLDGAYFAGMATGGWCRANAYSVSNVARKRTNGSTGVPFSTTIMAHELGHTLGAWHVDNPPYNLMNTNALGLVKNDIPPLLAQSKIYIDWCYNSRYAKSRRRRNGAWK